LVDRPYSLSVDYPNVKKSHIVPRTYLANFAENEKIGTRIDDATTSLVLPVSQVGTRRRFYRRERGDGTPIDDLEWSLGHGEDAATPILREFNERWPLSREDKIKLGELFGYQMIRGPRWREWRRQKTQQIIEEYRRDGTLKVGDTEHILTEEQLDVAQAAFLTDTAWATRMLSLGPTLATLIGSMHWTLVEFSSPLIATSDDPVVVWPLGVTSRQPQPQNFDAGLRAIEIRLPLSPRHIVLMTWADIPDDEQARTRGSRHHAANFNAFTVAQRDRQWFHLPGTNPPLASGQLLPVSLELVKGYSAATASRSKRLATVWDHVQTKLGRGLEDRDITHFRID
jgi:hypothetical protein